MLMSALFVLMAACESSSDRHALTGPESARLVSHIAIKPSWGIVGPDEVEEFVAYVKSGRGQTVSRQVTWSSSDGSVLDVDASGRVIGVNEGSAALAASYQGLTEQITVDVKGEVVGLKLSHTSLTLEEGQTEQLKATYVYGNGAERPAGRVQWQSSDPSIIQIDSDGLARAISSGTTTITAQSRGQKSQSDGVVNSGRVAKVEVGAPTTRLQVGEEVQFWADIWDANGNRMQKNVQWSSSNTSVATVSSDGLVRGQGAGQATITAKSGPESGTLAVEVTSEPVSDEEKASRPGGVTSLLVASTGETKATLRFTEVDDGTGSPAQYEVRYALSPLGFGWGTATTVSKGTCKVPLQGTGVGNTLSCTVEGLQPSTKYDFQLVAYRGELNNGAEFGPLSNIGTGTTKDAAIQVEVLPSGATLEEGEQVQLQATVTDAYGNKLNKSVSWSSTRTSVATASSGGLVTAVAPGDTEVRASAESVSDAAKIRVMQPPSNGIVPSRGVNEPSGLTRLAQWDYSQAPPQYWGRSGELRSDSNSPASPPGYWQTILPKGLEGGRGVTHHAFSFSRQKEVYVALWVRLPWRDGGWENHAVGTKMIYFLHGMDTGAASTLFWYNGSTQKVDGVWPLGFDNKYFVNGTPTREGLNGGSWVHGGRFTVGEWHLVEVYLKLNDRDRFNGIYKLWIDGDLKISRSDRRYISPSNDWGFYTVKMANVWGGVGGTKTRDDFIDYDHIYISGRPQ